MSVIKILLIDDEQAIRNICKLYLKERTDVVLLGECETIGEAATVIKATNPDAILLDIHLHNQTGFDLLAQFPNPLFRVIFITAYEQYAIKALKSGALDYLLKPINEEEFHKAIDKLISSTPPNIAQTQLVLDSYKTRKIDRISLRVQEGTYLIWLQDLVYCFSEGGYTTFVLQDNNKVMVSNTLKEYEMILPIDMFIRCHHSYIVNISFVRKLNKDNMLLLKNGDEIPVSVRKKDEVLQLFQ